MIQVVTPFIFTSLVSSTKRQLWPIFGELH